MKEKMFQFSVIAALLVIAACIGIPLLLSERAEEVQQSFQENSTIIKIRKKDLVTTTTKRYKDIKKQLENDYYFRKVATMPSMEVGTLPPSYTQTLLEQYMYNFSTTNKKHFTYTDEEMKTYCLSKGDVKEGYKELFNLGNRVDDFIKYLPGYYEYVTIENNSYCFYLGGEHVPKESALVGIEKLGYSDGDSILANMYVYTYGYTGSSTQKKYINDVKGYIEAERYSDASKVVTNKLKGTVTHKQLKFKVNSNPKFYKYQVIKSAIIK